jgi:cysteine-rich repeat protein
MRGRIGRYTILRRVAQGGMAEIYLARLRGHKGFRKRVALKMMLPAQDRDDRLVRMFEDEARLGALLSHPNIVPVLDIGAAGGRPFFTMEYVNGPDLRRMVERAHARTVEIPLEVAVAIMLGVAAGLHHAHERTDEQGRPMGIVHRDVSASNVLVGFDGQIKLIDFGVAKAASNQAGTAAGFVKGKRGAMSPEQCAGETLDRRSDIFSAGLLLYELTTGLSPFPDDSEYGIVHTLVETGVPAPSTRKPGYPPALEAIVMRALARSREDRFATARELQVELETFAAALGLPISPLEVAAFLETLFTPEERRDAAATAEAERSVAVVRDHWPVILGAGLVVAAAGVWGLAGRGGALSSEGGPRCGDGIVRAGVEDCDDGNAVDGDACPATCRRCDGGAARMVRPETGVCYTRHDEPRSWDEAARVCAAHDAHLMSYTTGYEYLAVFDQLLRGTSARYWLGFRRRPARGFEWQSGEAGSPNALNWADGEPAPAGGDCALQSTSEEIGRTDKRGPWMAAPCDAKAAFLCKSPPWQVRRETGHAYRLLGQPLPWAEARDACVRARGHLATIDDATEDNFVKTQFPGARWLGAAVTGDTVAWVTGEATHFRDFADGEPDGKPPEGRPFCLAIDSDSHWHDRPCASLYPSVCEID